MKRLINFLLFLVVLIVGLLLLVSSLIHYPLNKGVIGLERVFMGHPFWANRGMVLVPWTILKTLDIIPKWLRWGLKKTLSLLKPH